MAFFLPKKPSTPPSSHALWKSHRKGWAVMLILLTASTSLVSQNASHLQLSVLTTPQHSAFDGTTYPIAEVPDWLTATSEERELPYSDFPESKLVDLPSYDPSRLRVDSETLEWGDEYDDYTREMKITYPVPYAGNYELDGVEGAGSHPAVDMKTISGTPVFSIMNGVVEEVTYSNSGFGNLIVIRSDDVPTLEDSTERTTLYVGYAHLSAIEVTEGEVVSKGEQIGAVGMTGTATTNHLHFQIDNDEAPWHLYWPFTSAESNAVGGFFEAINQGVGSDNLYKYTVNPLEYVEKYLDPNSVSTPTVEEDTEEEVIEEEIVEEEIVEEPVEVEETDEGPFSAIETSTSSYMHIESQQTVTVSVVDDRGELVRQPQFNAPIKVTVEDPSVLEVFPLEIGKASFTTGETTLNIYAKQVGTSEVTLTFGSISTSFEIVVTAELMPLVSFALETDDGFYVGEAKEVAIVALDENGNRIPEFNFEGSLQLSVMQGEGFFSRDILSAADFTAGIASVTFTPMSQDEVVLSASLDAVTGTSATLAAALFSDLSENHPYYQAIEYLKTVSVIEGYPDRTFRADNPVSRVEALKLIFAGLNKEVVTGVPLSFPDTNSEEWYAPYVATAQRDGIIKGYPDGTLKPSNEVNRVEFTKMLTEAMGVDVDPVVISSPYDDVHYLEWYAPYAQFVKTTNVAPWNESNFNPSASMTRAEVAEMIYRVLAIQRNEAESYSRTLVLN